MRKPKRPQFATRRSGIRRPGTAESSVAPVGIKRWTGCEPDDWNGIVAAPKSDRYVRRDLEVGGDAPKDFIHVYEPTRGGFRPQFWRTWPAYIAKVGHQFYPAESVTEQLMTRVGQVCGLKIADSRLMVCAQQLRFLSRYFLRSDEILNHGADILGGYLEDKKFVDGVADARAEKDLFTFQVFCTAIRTRFPDYADEILRGFVRMIGFDAMVGNKDRHFYNWGVITHLTGAVRPRFAPIYDTARGLFWNATEAGLEKYRQPDSMAGYIRHSQPQIGWDGWDEKRLGELDHFALVEKIASSDADHRHWLKDLSKKASESIRECEGMIDAEFSPMLSDLRRELVKQCLRQRFDHFATIL